MNDQSPDPDVDHIVQDGMGMPRRLSQMKAEAAGRGNGYDTAKIAQETDRIALLEDKVEDILGRLTELEEREHIRHGGDNDQA